DPTDVYKGRKTFRTWEKIALALGYFEGFCQKRFEYEDARRMIYRLRDMRNTFIAETRDRRMLGPTRRVGNEFVHAGKCSKYKALRSELINKHCVLMNNEEATSELIRRWKEWNVPSSGNGREDSNATVIYSELGKIQRERLCWTIRNL